MNKIDVWDFNAFWLLNYLINVVLVPPMLTECVDFLEERSQNSEFTYEIILVNDGSTDLTLKTTYNWIYKLGTDKFRVLNLETNRGKGGAVRLVNCPFF